MPAWYLRIIQRIIVICDDTLSMSLLIKTFFVPWHRDYSPVGRGFGIAMRMIYLPIAAFLSILLILGMFAVTIVWAFLPFIALFSILRSPFV